MTLWWLVVVALVGHLGGCFLFSFLFAAACSLVLVRCACADVCGEGCGHLRSKRCIEELGDVLRVVQPPFTTDGYASGPR